MTPWTSLLAYDPVSKCARFISTRLQLENLQSNPLRWWATLEHGLILLCQWSHSHIGKVCSKAICSLYIIRQTKKFFSEETTKILVHSFVVWHLDYCNAPLYGFSQFQYDRLQRALNAAARVVCLVPKFDHITPVLRRLHWRPVHYRLWRVYSIAPRE